MELAYAYAVPPVRAGAPLAGIVRHALCDAAESVAARDLRWPAALERLRALREAGRRSVRIVDAACGDGALLLPAVRRARAFGFVSIEARGVDSDPALIAHARRAAAGILDLAKCSSTSARLTRRCARRRRSRPTSCCTQPIGRRWGKSLG
jgi:SAM-dependent methyltransferase